MKVPRIGTRPRVGLRRSWQTLAPVLIGSRRRLLVLSVFAFLGGVAEAGLLVVVVELSLSIAGEETTVDLAIGPSGVSGLSVPVLFLLAVGTAAGRLIFQLTAAWLTGRLTADLLTDLRAGTAEDFVDASWALQSAESDGAVQDLLIRHVFRTSTAIIQVASAVTTGFSFLAMLASAFLLHAAAAAVIIVAVAVLFFLLRPLSKMARRYANEQSRAGQAYSQAALEVISMLQEVRTFNVNRPVIDHLSRVTRSEAGPYFRSQVLNRSLPPLYQLAAIAIVLGGLFAVHAVVDAELASLGAVVLVLVRALSYSGALQSSYHNIAELTPYAERLVTERDRFARSVDPSGDRPAPPIERLAFDDVSFAYRADRPALTHMSFEVDAGRTIGVVGPSGSGKSTLVALLLRLRRPDHGRYMVNGVPADEFERAGWFQRVAFVPQDARLFSGSIRDNIVFFRSGFTDGEVEEAARRAHIHDDIAAWTDRYDTLVGPRGGALSGGQRQRVALARALLGQPDLLVLDEPTSALDMQSEQLVHRSLSELKGRVTMFIIAHRLSTLNTCDRVMVLSDGRLQAFDRREELERSSPFYREALALSRLS